MFISMARGWHQLHATASDGLDHGASAETREVGGGWKCPAAWTGGPWSRQARAAACWVCQYFVSQHKAGGTPAKEHGPGVRQQQSLSGGVLKEGEQRCFWVGYVTLGSHEPSRSSGHLEATSPGDV